MSSKGQPKAPCGSGSSDDERLITGKVAGLFHVRADRNAPKEETQQAVRRMNKLEDKVVTFFTDLSNEMSKISAIDFTDKGFQVVGEGLQAFVLMNESSSSQPRSPDEEECDADDDDGASSSYSSSSDSYSGSKSLSSSSSSSDDEDGTMDGARCPKDSDEDDEDDSDYEGSVSSSSSSSSSCTLSGDSELSTDGEDEGDEPPLREKGGGAKVADCEDEGDAPPLREKRGGANACDAQEKRTANYRKNMRAPSSTPAQNNKRGRMEPNEKSEATLESECLSTTSDESGGEEEEEEDEGSDGNEASPKKQRREDGAADDVPKHKRKQAKDFFLERQASTPKKLDFDKAGEGAEEESGGEESCTQEAARSVGEDDQDCNNDTEGEDATAEECDRDGGDE